MQALSVTAFEALAGGILISSPKKEAFIFFHFFFLSVEEKTLIAMDGTAIRIVSGLRCPVACIAQRSERV